MSDWPSMLRTARSMMRLTQEDFAADCGVSRSHFAQWETGRKPLTRVMKRRILDIMGGYYRYRPEFKALHNQAESLKGFVTLYREGMIIQEATSRTKNFWLNSNCDQMLGQAIIPLLRHNMKSLEITENFLIKMFNKKSDIISISFSDQSLIIPQRYVKRAASIYTVGEGRVIYMEDTLLSPDYYPVEENEVKIITMDDAD